jgi:hypothetical protein
VGFTPCKGVRDSSMPTRDRSSGIDHRKGGGLRRELTTTIVLASQDYCLPPSTTVRELTHTFLPGKSSRTSYEVLLSQRWPPSNLPGQPTKRCVQIVRIQ